VERLGEESQHGPLRHITLGDESGSQETVKQPGVDIAQVIAHEVEGMLGQGAFKHYLHPEKGKEYETPKPNDTTTKPPGNAFVYQHDGPYRHQQYHDEGGP
jgi:hypothetical protein